VNGTPPSIFRPAAVRHYARSQAETVPPRFVSPRTFLILWILLTLLMVSSLSAWFARVPVYASTLAITVRVTGTSDGVDLAVLVPPDLVGRLRVGQSLLLDAGGRQGTPASGYPKRRIIALDRTVRSPEALRRRFGLQSTAALTVTRPAAIAFARLGPLPDRTPASRYFGSIYQVDVEVGSTRVLALVPIVGQLLGG